ncbi:MAG: hypothetical protein ACRBHB_08240 [Arenicella sp.]
MQLNKNLWLDDKSDAVCHLIIMNDPYTPPESELEEPLGPRPKQIYYVLMLLVLSCLLSITQTYLASLTEEGLAMTDPINIGFSVLWFAVVAWLAIEIADARSSSKNTMFFLAVIVAVLSYFSLDNSYIAYLGFAEAICFFVCGLILKSKSLETWFR